MKVEYKCTYERVNEIIDAATRDDREIDYIELTHAEWHNFLIKTMGHHHNMQRLLSGEPTTYRSVTIRRNAPRSAAQIAREASMEQSSWSDRLMSRLTQ